MTGPPTTGPGTPSTPIALGGAADATTTHLDAPTVSVDGVVERLRDVCAVVSIDADTRRETSRDWWPLPMTWAANNEVAAIAGVVARPSTGEEIRDVARVCNDARIPLTVAAGRSGVSGASVPLHGGVVLDMCDVAGIVDVDDRSLIAHVRCGTFGDHFEHALRTEHQLTAGHWPQSMTLATVGGWIACRGAGQLSTRYGKIEDIVSGLDVVLADGTLVQTGDQPRQAVGGDLTQLFVGSEGTLGIIESARLRLHPAPTHERRGAWGFDSFSAGLDACRRILRRGATPAVLRLYDEIESNRNYGTGDAHCVVVALDEGDEPIVDGTWTVVEQECASADRLDDSLVEHWLETRNNVAALERLISGGLVVDTMEIAAPWAALDAIYQTTIAAIGAVPGTLSVSAHQSHSYLDGACLYFTFAGQPGELSSDDYYREVWNRGTRAVLDGGGALSHHHSVGLNRARFVAEALGAGHDVLRSIKTALDPNGILNPGKMGFDDPFGPPVQF